MSRPSEENDYTYPLVAEYIEDTLRQTVHKAVVEYAELPGNFYGSCGNWQIYETGRIIDRVLASYNFK